jgi:hypothetical protein
MTPEKVDHAPQVRCYRCGSTTVYSLCHHCARPMCRKHSPMAFRQGGHLVREVGGEARDSAKVASREFTWLKQSDLRRTAVYHCEDHAHVVRRTSTLITSGVVIAVLGVIVLLFSFPPGLVLLLAGAGLVAGAVVQRNRQAVTDPASRPALPLFPHVDSVEVVERLNGKVSLSGGTYTSTAEEHVQGEITIEMSANDGQAWLPLYRKKYRLPQHDPIRFAAGFAMIKGKAGLSFADEQNVVLDNGTGLSFSGDSAEGHPLFETVPGQPPGDWKPVVRYDVQKARAPREIPLWIVPSVVPSSDRRTLEIDLHWNNLGIEGDELHLTGFELIELDVPKDWGAVEGFVPGGPTIGSGDKGRRIIRWEQLGPTENTGDQQRRTHGNKSRTLILQFEKPILPAPSEDARGIPGEAKSAKAESLLIKGTLKATFGGTLSGIEGIEIYLPGGAALVPLRADGVRVKEGQPVVQSRTEVTVQFSIGLEEIRYQDDWVVPDDSNARRQEAEAELADGGMRRGGNDSETIKFRNKTDEFHVVPDYRTVTKLTNLISKEGYYVKSVVEHLPYRDDGRANVINHVWDIAGRWYEGVFPIDFDVNLRGEDLGEDGSGPLLGRAVAQVTVKGTYVNEAGLAQRKKIEERWDKLYGHVTELLRSQSPYAEGTPAIAADAGDEWSDAFEQDIGADDDYDLRADRFPRDTVIVDAEVIKTIPAEDQPYDQSRTDDVGDLRRQRKALVDALLAGRISEDTYREIVARIDAELRDLGKQP